MGTIVDITANMYTIEIDEKYKTGDVDKDILIIDSKDIVNLLKEPDDIQYLDDSEQN